MATFNTTVPIGAAGHALGWASGCDGMPEPGQRLLVGRLPLTARSNSSLETPRTGGGFTARSAGERGTPRDAQRLALGERPRGDVPPREALDALRLEGGLVGAPLLSPQHTARSVTLSSEPWSRTPSSQGDSLSSRSRFDTQMSARLDSLSYCGAPEELPSNNGASGRPHVGLLPDAQCHTHGADRYHLDLQKNLEVMRFVIMRENQKLKDLVQQVREQLCEAEGDLAQASCAHQFCRTYRTSAQGHHPVEWRLEHIGGRLAALCRGSAGTCVASEDLVFTMPPCAQIRATVSARRLAAEGRDGVTAEACPPKLAAAEGPLSAAAGSASHGEALPGACAELSLEVRGPRCVGAELSAALFADLGWGTERPELARLADSGVTTCALAPRELAAIASGALVCRIETKATATCLAAAVQLQSTWR